MKHSRRRLAYKKKPTQAPQGKKQCKMYVIRNRRGPDGARPSCPDLRCNMCGHIITDAYEAAAVWGLGSKPQHVSHCHKRCLRILLPDRPPWQPLPTYLGLLIHNLGLSCAELKRRVSSPGIQEGPPLRKPVRRGKGRVAGW